MFPIHRGRRLRVNESIRSLVRETTLSPSDFMFPMFITEGENVKVEIPSMVGIYRRSIDLTVEEVKELFALGIRAVNIYVKVDESLKDNTGKEVVAAGHSLTDAELAQINWFVEGIDATVAK